MITKRYFNSVVRLMITVVALAGCATKPGRIWQEVPVPPVDARADLGLEGYDAVAYFTDHRPVKGNAAYTTDWQGVTWQFASAEHRDLFAADPLRYEPQYGGYCAYAVSHGVTAHGDPNQWDVVDGRLFVNNNPLARKLWESHRARDIRTGDVNWPLIPKTK
jgi:YHS domain-containing protein